MDFSLSSDQTEMFNLAKKFALNEMIPKAAEFDEKEEFPTQIIKKAWELGFMNTCIPAEFGSREDLLEAAQQNFDHTMHNV